MVWFLSLRFQALCSTRSSVLINPSFPQCIIPSFSLQQSTGTHHTLPFQEPNHDRLLLSLLLKHQSGRNPTIQVHSQLITTGLHRDGMGGTGITLWNLLLRHYSLGSFPEEALQLYRQMLDICSGVLPTDTFTFSFLLKACANLSRPEKGSQIHSLTFKKGFEFDVYVQTALVNMYSVCGFLGEARRAFDEMPERNSVTWNALITGLTKWGELDLARLLFERMPGRNVVSWTGMVDGYARANRPMEALLLFQQMMAEGTIPTEITVFAIVPAISCLGALDMGESIHVYCKKAGFSMYDVRVGNSLIDMYARCGCIKSSLKVFDEMSDIRNLVSWTSIISGFAMHGMAEESMELFQRMGKANIRPNRVTCLSVLNACSHGGLVEEGLRFFSDMVNEHGIEPEIKHYGCMIDMLGRAGRLEEAEKMIIGMPLEVNVVVWRTLLGCCSKHGDAEMGERVMGRILELEKRYGGDYVILSNTLAGAGRYCDAERVRRLLDDRNAIKLPGHSLIGRKE